MGMMPIVGVPGVHVRPHGVANRLEVGVVAELIVDPLDQLEDFPGKPVELPAGVHIGGAVPGTGLCHIRTDGSFRVVFLPGADVLFQVLVQGLRIRQIRVVNRRGEERVLDHALFPH